MSWIIIICCIYICVTFRFGESVDPHRTAMIMSVETTSGRSMMKYIEGDPDVWVPIVKTGGNQPIKDFGKSNSNDVFEKLSSSFNQSNLVWSNSVGNEIEYARVVLFSSSFSTSVKRAHYDSSKQIGGITVDWTTNNIYWTDQIYNWILMAPLDERRVFSSVVSTGLDKPGGICVHPAKSLLFWTDYGSQPKIERSDLLGQNRKTIVLISLLKPVTIDIDLRTDSLYWADSAISMIETCKLDGSQRRGLIQNSFVSHIVGISLFKDHMFAVSSNSYLHLINTSSPANPKSVSLSKIYTTMTDVTTMSEVTQPNIDSPCNSARCSSMCVGTVDNHRAQCVCPWGQVLGADDISCTVSSFKPSPLYIYTSNTNLCWYNVWAPDMLNNQIQLNCDHSFNAHSNALGFHHSQKYLYIGSGNKINRLLMKSGETVQPFITNAGTVRAISVDWIHDNIYWTSAEGFIMTSNLSDPRDNKKTIVTSLNDGVYGLIVEPFSGHLFWTSYGGSPYIKRSLLDGSAPVTLVSSNIIQPESLTIDYADFRLYWTDSVNSTIESINLDGTQRTQMINVVRSRPYGIAVFQDYIAWTDQKSSFPSIQWWDKADKSFIRSHRQLSNSGSLVLYGEYSQPTNFTAPDITSATSSTSTTARTTLSTATEFYPKMSSTENGPVGKESASGVPTSIIIITSVLAVVFVFIIVLVVVGIFIFCFVIKRRNHKQASPEATVMCNTPTSNTAYTDLTRLSNIPPVNSNYTEIQPVKNSEYHDDEQTYDVIDDKNIDQDIEAGTSKNKYLDSKNIESDYLTPQISSIPADNSTVNYVTGTRFQ